MVRRHPTNTNLWRYFAGGIVIAIVVAAIRWSFEHPYPAFWDEAGYLNDVLIDAQRLVHGMVFRLAGRILLKSYGRPPAYRILALPFLVVLGFHPTSARLMCVACFALSAWFIYRTARLLGNEVAGALALLVFSLSPIVVSASVWFSTEGPLFLATSAFLYYLFVCWTDESGRPANWVGLGLATGLGFLSKTTFAAIAFPVLAFWLVAGQWAKIGIPRLQSQIKAGALALVVAAPWWILNFRSSLAYTIYARDFAENSLGAPSIATWTKWLETVSVSLLGFGLSLLIGLIAILFLWKVLKQRASILDPLHKAALWVCACAGLPVVIVQLSGTNHLLRHISPAIIPLAIALGILADRTGWTRHRSAMTLTAVLFVTQLIILIAPVIFPNKLPAAAGFVNGPFPWSILDRREQLDWRRLEQVSDGYGCHDPTISYIGIGPGLSPPEIEYPWVLQAALTSDSKPTFATANLLWRPEDGPIDWRKVMDAASQGDIAMTVPNYAGLNTNNQAYNQNNAEFATRLSKDPRFQGPISISMGRFEPIEVAVFARKNSSCNSLDAGPG